MHTTPKRIKLLPHAPETDIITTDDRYLGKMLPGLGYWVTPDNLPVVTRLLDAGHAVEDEPSKAPLVPGMSVRSIDALMQGNVEVQDAAAVEGNTVAIPENHAGQPHRTAD